jgi:hypothetical protein
MRLTSVTANRHVFDGQVNGNPLRLLLSFENGRRLRLAVTGDGSGMLADAMPLDKPFDMGECGTVVVEDVTGSLFPTLRAADVMEVRALELDARQVGVHLLLGVGEAFHFWVEDDELFWGDGAALTTHDWPDGLIPTVGKPVKV